MFSRFGTFYLFPSVTCVVASSDPKKQPGRGIDWVQKAPHFPSLPSFLPQLLRACLDYATQLNHAYLSKMGPTLPHPTPNFVFITWLNHIVQRSLHFIEYSRVRVQGAFLGGWRVALGLGLGHLFCYPQRISKDGKRLFSIEEVFVCAREGGGEFQLLLKGDTLIFTHLWFFNFKYFSGVSGAAVRVLRADVAAGPSGVSALHSQGQSHAQDHVASRRVPHAAERQVSQYLFYYDKLWQIGSHYICNHLGNENIQGQFKILPPITFLLRYNASSRPFLSGIPFLPSKKWLIKFPVWYTMWKEGITPCFKRLRYILVKYTD